MTVLEKFIIRHTLQEPELCNNIKNILSALHTNFIHNVWNDLIGFKRLTVCWGKTVSHGISPLPGQLVFPGNNNYLNPAMAKCTIEQNRLRNMIRAIIRAILQ